MQKCIERTRMQSEEIIVEQLSVDQSLTVSHNDDRKKYICDFCGLTLFSRAGIRSHILHKHLGLQTVTGAQTKTEVCTVCGVYVTRRNFKDHVNSHSNSRDFKCQFCGAAVKSIFTLRKHIRRVHMKVKLSTLPVNVQKSECLICDRQFSGPEGLRRHELRYHSNSGNIRCEVCDKISLTLAEHNYHMKIHSLERKFQCEFCECRFARYEGLKNHVIKHKTEWSYKCGLCSKIFKHSSSVSGHRKSHKVNGYYHCGCCDDRFKDYAQLKNHFVNLSHSFYSKVKQETE